VLLIYNKEASVFLSGVNIRRSQVVATWCREVLLVTRSLVVSRLSSPGEMQGEVAGSSRWNLQERGRLDEDFDHLTLVECNL
jgi:hypothetical protein